MKWEYFSVQFSLGRCADISQYLLTALPSFLFIYILKKYIYIVYIHFKKTSYCFGGSLVSAGMYEGLSRVDWQLRNGLKLNCQLRNGKFCKWQLRTVSWQTECVAGKKYNYLFWGGGGGGGGGERRGRGRICKKWIKFLTVTSEQ